MPPQKMVEEVGRGTPSSWGSPVRGLKSCTGYTFQSRAHELDCLRAMQFRVQGGKIFRSVLRMTQNITFKTGGIKVAFINIV